MNKLIKVFGFAAVLLLAGMASAISWQNIYQGGNGFTISGYEANRITQNEYFAPEYTLQKQEIQELNEVISQEQMNYEKCLKANVWWGAVAGYSFEEYLNKYSIICMLQTIEVD